MKMALDALCEGRIIFFFLGKKSCVSVQIAILCCIAWVILFISLLSRENLSVMSSILSECTHGNDRNKSIKPTEEINGTQ